MLDLALNKEQELQEKFRSTWFSEKYKFWANANYYEESELKKGTWEAHQFVSLNSANEVIGYIAYEIDRITENVCGLSIINFTDDKLNFGMDVGNVLTDIFKKFHFRKLNFCVVIGNPIEQSYDRLIKKYHGRVVGIQKEQTKLLDGKYYDMKMYEILAEDYFKVMEHSRKKQTKEDNLPSEFL